MRPYRHSRRRGRELMVLDQVQDTALADQSLDRAHGKQQERYEVSHKLFAPAVPRIPSHPSLTLIFVRPRGQPIIGHGISDPAITSFKCRTSTHRHHELHYEYLQAHLILDQAMERGAFVHGGGLARNTSVSVLQGSSLSSTNTRRNANERGTHNPLVCSRSHFLL